MSLGEEKKYIPELTNFYDLYHSLHLNHLKAELV